MLRVPVRLKVYVISFIHIYLCAYDNYFYSSMIQLYDYMGVVLNSLFPKWPTSQEKKSFRETFAEPSPCMLLITGSFSKRKRKRERERDRDRQTARVRESERGSEEERD